MSRDPKSFNPGDEQVHKAADDLAEVYGVVDDILLSLCGRSGIGDAIEGCDEEIKQEIRSDLAKIVEAYGDRVFLHTQQNL